jgi:thiosulfate dehydrogenase
MRAYSLVLLLVLGCGGLTVQAEQTFKPPLDYPPGPMGEMVIKGERIFTKTASEIPAYVGNVLTCENCHLDRGRLKNSSPLWGSYPIYPQYRARSKRVETLAQRIQSCFRFSMNGSEPDLDDDIIVALESYMFWIAQGVPTGKKMEGRGYPAVLDADQEPSPQRGRQVYAGKCMICHGEDGQGTGSGRDYAFPPLWGPLSYNWAAGMTKVEVAAAFIKSNMPFGLAGSLADQEAWDVAAFISSRPRGQDPRFRGNLAETREKYHGEGDYYGKVVDGVQLGAPPPTESHPGRTRKIRK